MMAVTAVGDSSKGNFEQSQEKMREGTRWVLEEVHSGQRE